MCEYFGGKPSCAVKAKEWDGISPHHWRRQIVYSDARQQEHMCWDPKGGELFPNQLKPGESRVEGFRDTDVQIVLVI